MINSPEYLRARLELAEETLSSMIEKLRPLLPEHVIEGISDIRDRWLRSVDTLDAAHKEP